MEHGHKPRGVGLAYAGGGEAGMEAVVRSAKGVYKSSNSA